MPPHKPTTKTIVRSDHHLSPVAKAVVLCHSMEAVAHSLTELIQQCELLGEDALGREAMAIQEMLLQRRKVLMILAEKASRWPDQKPVRTVVKTAYGQKKQKTAQR